MNQKLLSAILVFLMVSVAGWGFAAPANAETPCATEDAVGPCRWDAAVQGDGQGQSFTVTAEGEVIYDDPDFQPVPYDEAVPTDEEIGRVTPTPSPRVSEKHRPSLPSTGDGLLLMVPLVKPSFYCVVRINKHRWVCQHVPWLNPGMCTRAC